VLDGKQRLPTLWQFAGSNNADGDSFRLTGLELRSDLTGMRLKGLPDVDRDVLETQTIRTVVLRNWKTEDFLYLVFLRLNTGNLLLSPQERRQALHPGPFFVFANDFTANSRTFHRCFAEKAPDFRVRDVSYWSGSLHTTAFFRSTTGISNRCSTRLVAQLNRAWAQERMDLEQRASDGDAQPRLR
jgi:hypothetical protein